MSASTPRETNKWTASPSSSLMVFLGERTHKSEQVCQKRHDLVKFNNKPHNPKEEVSFCVLRDINVRNPKEAWRCTFYSFCFATLVFIKYQNKAKEISRSLFFPSNSPKQLKSPFTFPRQDWNLLHVSRLWPSWRWSPNTSSQFFYSLSARGVMKNSDTGFPWDQSGGFFFVLTAAFYASFKRYIPSCQPLNRYLVLNMNICSLAKD